MENTGMLEIYIPPQVAVCTMTASNTPIEFPGNGWLHLVKLEIGASLSFTADQQSDILAGQ